MTGNKYARAFAVILMLCVSASAAPITWDGGGASGLWNTGTNWDTDLIPNAGDDLIFDGAVRTATTNDIATTNYASVTFAGTADAFTLAGNDIQIDAAGNITNNSANSQAVTLGVVALGGLTVDAAAGDVSLGAIDLSAGGPLTFQGASNTQITGAVIGTGSVTILGTGNVTLSGTNTYTGGTTVTAGTLTGTTTSLQGDIANASAVVFDQAGDGTYAGAMSGAGSLEKLGTGNVTLSGTNTYTGGTTVTAGTLTGTTTSLQGDIVNNSAVVFDQAVNGTYAGAMSGAGSLEKLGAGNVTLSGANTYTGGTILTVGILTGTTTSLQGDITNNSVLVFDQAVDGTYAGVISGAGTLTKLGAGSLTLTGANAYAGGTTVTAGTLVLDGTSGTGLMLLANGATLMGVGTVGGGLVSDGTTAPGNSIGTLNVAGYYSLGATGTLDVEIAKVAGNPQSDLLNVTGTATLANGSTISVTDISAPGDEVLTNEQYTVITAAGGVTDNGATIQSNSAFLDFTAAVAGNDYILTARRQTSFAAIAVGGNNSEIASALDADSAMATGDYARLINGLLLADAASFNRQARLLSGEQFFGMDDVAIRSGLQSARNLRRYLSARRRGPAGVSAEARKQTMSPAIASTSDDPTFLAAVMDEAERVDRRRARQPEAVGREWQVTALPFGDFYSRQTTNNQIGYRAYTGGVTVAVDKNISEKTIVGLHSTYGHSEVRFREGAGDGTVDSLRVGPYATLYGDNAFIEGSVSYGAHWTSLDRDVIVAGVEETAKSDYVAQDVTTHLGGGYTLDLAGWDVTPAFGLYYTVFHRPGFDEHGAGGANLDVESKTTQSLRSDLELGVSKVFDCGFARVMPEIYGGWRHTYCGKDSLGARFKRGVASFTLDNDTIRDQAYFGLGVSVLLSEDLSLYVQYEGGVSADDTTNNIAIGAGLRF